MGATINSRMGLSTWAAFFGTDANVEIIGDVAMLSQEVTPVLKAHRANRLNVVAIHNHITTGEATALPALLEDRAKPETRGRV